MKRGLIKAAVSLTAILLFIFGISGVTSAECQDDAVLCPVEDLKAFSVPEGESFKPGARVKVDVGRIASLKQGDIVKLIVDNNTVIQAITDTVEVEKGGYRITWTGRSIDPSERVTSILILTIVEGKVSGTIQTSTMLYNLTPLETDGEALIVDTSKMIPVGDKDIRLPENDLSKDKQTLIDRAVSVALNQTTAGEYYIDMLAVYTRKLVEKYGSDAAVRSMIQSAVNYDNAAFAKSNTGVKIRIKEYRKIEAPAEDPYTIYKWINNLPWLAKADVDQVTVFFLFNESSKYCGIGEMPSSESHYRNTLISVVGFGEYSRGALKYYCPVETFAHEIGHNFGCNHDRANAAAFVILPYAYGYCGPNYGTIMAYCWPKVPYFSEDRIVEGKVIGNAGAQNAKVIRYTAPLFEKIKPENPCTIDDRIQKLYLAYYQRPGDPGGIAFWTEALNKAGGDMKSIINAFATSPESRSLYGDINATTIGNVVDGIYQALFNRPAEPEGKKFYVEGFLKGHFTPGTIALSILEGAREWDLTTVNNKLTVANAFTCKVAATKANYAGDRDASTAREFLRTVSESRESLEAALSKVDSVVHQISP